MTISINDHADIRSVFAGLPMQSVDPTCAVGGGDRETQASELLIGNREGDFESRSFGQTGMFDPDMGIF